MLQFTEVRPAAIMAFERALAEAVGARRAIAVHHHAAGLHLACLTVGLGPGDVCWIAPNVSPASAMGARACGATVDFVDLDPATHALSTRALTEKLNHAERHGRLPKVLIASHFAGHPCDLAGLNHLANLYGFYLIEDASTALGARYGETRVGDCRYSDMVVFATGAGGMVTTNRDDWARTIRRLGEPYAMPECLAASGLSRLANLDLELAGREALAARYDAAIADLPVVTPWRNPDHRSAHGLYVIRLRPEARDAALAAMRAAGIAAEVCYPPLYRQPSYQPLGDFPEAERHGAEALGLPLAAGMREEEQDRVIAALRAAIA